MAFTIFLSILFWYVVKFLCWRCSNAEFNLGVYLTRWLNWSIQTHRFLLAQKAPPSHITILFIFSKVILKVRTSNSDWTSGIEKVCSQLVYLLLDAVAAVDESPRKPPWNSLWFLPQRIEDVSGTIYMQCSAR